MNQNKIHRYTVGALPILHQVICRINLRNILSEILPTNGNEMLHPADVIMLLACNLCLGKQPVYKLGEWINAIDLRALGYQEPNSIEMNDDRFGRALDKLYQCDRASLLTRIVLSAVKAYDIDLSRIHNDSTSIKSHASQSTVTNTGVQFKHGHSKDHRPDLKQLIFSMSITADGGVPVHHKVYSGNRSDDTTHIETWDTLVRICGRKDFVYVADSKLCTDEQLSYIALNSGQAITIMPRTWGDYSTFIQRLKTTTIHKQEIWRRKKPGGQGEQEYFSAFKGDYFTKNGYRIHWIYSSSKKKRDREYREQILLKTEKKLTELIGKLNYGKLKTLDAVENKAQGILELYGVTDYITLELGTTPVKEMKQIGKGRPGAKTDYEEIITEDVTLRWNRNKCAIETVMKTDGVFPLLSTNPALDSATVLKYYKYQPNIEKRFSQFKNVHQVAPLLFKKIERIESNLFVIFIAMMIQSIVEREIRRSMLKQNVKSIEVYPEHRCSYNPTANAIFELFELNSTYQIKNGDKLKESYHDELTQTQTLIIDWMNIRPNHYWGK